MTDDDGAFEAGRGGVVVGADELAARRLRATFGVPPQENVEAPKVRFWVLPSGNTPNGTLRYIDPEQTASRTREWPDDAA